jgi:5-formyltetrahydrofolate cyclo-ligase
MTRDVVTPDACIVPLVGFDGEQYRLGYGGGYYDRTLAALERRAFCVGLGFAEARLPSIFPQPHDIPMQAIVTD